MLLRLQNIGKIYDSNNILTIGIRNVNLEFDSNEFVIIEGESGSGKSTLLNVIGANDTFEEGELFIEGDETSHYTPEEWEKYRERYITTIFQDFNIIENLTVSENVELALLRISDVKERKKFAQTLIDKVGLNKQTNQKGSKLSGGEKQRTVIARALAKDSPIILADEPTGNLDVKSSKEIAALLKEVSKDKLVIVVTHNAEFFKSYATRRIRTYDGKISEDRHIEQSSSAPQNRLKKQDATLSKKQAIKNTLWLGLLNYKSRPKFTAMMSVALIVCAITFFMAFNVFSDSLIKPLRITLDQTPVSGKVIISSDGEHFSENDIGEITAITNAGFYLPDNDLSQFEVSVPKMAGMLSSHTVTCVYAPYKYSLSEGEAVLVLPVSSGKDENYIKSIFSDADAGITSIRTEKNVSDKKVYLYLGADTLKENGIKIMAINSSMKMGEDQTTVYTFSADESLESGTINFINSNYWDAKNKTIVFDISPAKAYSVFDDKLNNEEYAGMAVVMNPDDYAEIFSAEHSASRISIYLPDDSAALSAIKALPEGYVGMLSTGKVLVSNASGVFISNVLFYIVIIAAAFCFGMLISVIFMRSVKVFQMDFAVYRTLGISGKTASRSLYIQMAFIFLPTLILLPLVSLISAVIPGSTWNL